MQSMELRITSVQDRVDVAAILFKNGYRVSQKIVNTSCGKIAVLVVDREETA